MSTAESMLSGALAGCAVVMATHPIWTVNVSLKQSNTAEIRKLIMLP